MEMLKIKYLLLIICFIPALEAMSQAYTIERYNHERDSQAIAQIVRQNPAYLIAPKQQLEDGVNSALKYCASKNPDINTVVLRVNDSTVGFVNYWVSNMRPFGYTLTLGSVLHLLGVDKNHQRHGYGKILTEYALKDLEKVVLHTMLMTTPENTVAHNLYTALGFKSTEPTKKIWLYTHPANLKRDAYKAQQTQQLKKPLIIAGTGTALALIAGYYLLKNYKK